MSFFDRLLGRREKNSVPAAASRPASQLASVMTQVGAPSEATRRELLRVVLRDTLARHGIPAAWLGAEILTATSRDGVRGLHWRLVIQHWDPRFVQYAVAMQHALIQRAMSFDPMASEWLAGISWRFALDDESNCPPMPEASTWVAQAAPAPATSAAATSAAQLFATDVHIPAVPMPSPPAPAQVAEDDTHDIHADLEKLLAVRDADFANNSSEDAPTQPMWLPTEPGKY